MSTTAKIIEIADAIVGEINVHQWRQQIVAGRMFTRKAKIAPEPGEKVKALDCVRVRVRPTTRLNTKIARGHLTHDHGFLIGIDKLVGVEEDGEVCQQEVDDLILLVEEIENFFNDFHAIAGLSYVAVPTEIQCPEVYEFDALKVEHIFRSILTITVQTGQSAT